jgi:hypothetical protein
LEQLQSALDSSSRQKTHSWEFFQPENGIIKTSYMFQDCDYNVAIKFPYLEYHNTYKNVVVVRSLTTEDDYKTFFRTPILLSTEWAAYALKCFTSYSQFNMFIGGKKTNPILNQFHSPIKTLQLHDSSVFNSPDQSDIK